MTDSPHGLPDIARSLCADWLSSLRVILGDALAGFYLYGALTFPETGPPQDIDYHVFLTRPLTSAERQAIEAMHQRLARDHPPLGAETDGYYIDLADTHSLAPPRTQMWPLWRLPADASWALHCAHVRAGHCVSLHGPAPAEIYPEPTWPHLRAALYGEIVFVTDHLEEAPAYCVLNACRLLYSFTTRDVVVSKRFSGDWVLDRFPKWRDVIGAAMRAYDGTPTATDDRTLQSDVGGFVNWTWERIADLSGKRWSPTDRGPAQ